MPEFCKVERDGAVTTITIDRPEVMNALHPPANLELEKVFDDFCADPDQWVAIITGAGDRAFSAAQQCALSGPARVATCRPLARHSATPHAPSPP